MSTAVPVRAGRREWLGLVVLALPCVVYAMDLTVLNLALPALSTALRPTGAQLLWIVDIYGFMVAGALVTMGAVGDRFGARRVLMIGAAIFALASLVAAFATTAPMLIAARALLGLAGATLAPSTLSLIRELFHDSRQRTFAIGVWATSYSVGAAIGPLAGGALLHLFWWGSVLLLAVPVMVLLLVLGPYLLPADRPGGRTVRIDVLSAAMSLAAVLLLVYALKHVATSGLDARSTAYLAAGVGIGWVFLRRQRSLATPLIDMRLFRIGAFSGAMTANFVAFFVVFGMSVFLAQYLQSVLGLSALAAGAWSVPGALGFIAGAMVTPRLVRILAARTLIAGGLTTGGIGYGVAAFTDRSLAPLVAGTTLAAVGLAVVATLVTDIAVGAADRRRAGAAAAMSETSAELGGAVGIAVLGSVGAAVYRTTVADLAPDGLPGASSETIGGALADSGQLSSPAAAQLVAAAQEGFGQAFTVTGALGALALLAGAVAVTVVMRQPAHPSTEDGQSTDEVGADERMEYAS